MTWKTTIIKEIKSGAFWRDLIAEGLATSILVAIQCALPLTWGRPVTTIFLQDAIGMGFVVIVLIETFGQYGGAHMNPAVTISMLASNKITITRAILYICVQCACAVGGAGFIYGCTPADKRGTLSVTALNPQLTLVQGVFMEIFVTFIMVSCVHGSSNDRRRTLFMTSLPVGMSVTVGNLSGTNFTGASMNPARSFGPAVVMNNWKNHWIYWAGPIIGGLLAAILQNHIFDRIDRSKYSTETDALSSESKENLRMNEKYQKTPENHQESINL